MKMKMNKLLSVVLAFLMIVSISLVSVENPVYAAGAPGEVEIDKTAVRVPGTRDYDVTLSVVGNPLPVKNDIVLVLDQSGSMNWSMTTNSNPPAGEDSRWQILKAAANRFVDEVLATGLDNQVAVVSYSTDLISGSKYDDAKRLTDFSSNKTNVKNSYSSVSPGGTTNIQSGFWLARDRKSVV